MSVLVEVHDGQELERILSLKSFNLIGIMSKYSDIFSKHNIVSISESGINNSDDLKTLNSIGIKGVLIGERFMRESDIENSFKKLFNSI